jgi:hypothetical protein
VEGQWKYTPGSSKNQVILQWLEVVTHRDQGIYRMKLQRCRSEEIYQQSLDVVVEYMCEVVHDSSCIARVLEARARNLGNILCS